MAERYGSTDVHRFRYVLGLTGRRVLCDGVDITDRCTWFDDTTGEADVVTEMPPVLNRRGDGPELRRIRGHIEIVARHGC